MDEGQPPGSKVPEYTPRRSKCMEAAKARARAQRPVVTEVGPPIEIPSREQMMAMTERERIELAWALGRRDAALEWAQRQGEE